MPNFDTVWLLGLNPSGALETTPDTFNTLTTVLIVVSFVAAVLVGWRRADVKREAYPFLQVCGAALVAFLLWNKVHSPQYVLWLLPFFVLLRVHIAWWVAYSLADLAVYVGVFRWFYDYGFNQDLDEMTGAKELLIAGIWARALLLAVLFVVFLGARSGVESDPDHAIASQPSPRLPVAGKQPAPG